MIAIIKGCGTNIASIQFALERLGHQSVHTANAAEIKAATHVILPGVGSAPQAMSQLKEYQLINTIRELQQPVLGICIGMQILFDHSMEGDVACLGILSGTIVGIPQQQNLTIPHMGWNQLQMQKNSPLLKDIENNSHVYYVHSYAAPINDYTIASTCYGNNFTAMVQHNNFYGMQFHPEKSGQTGEIILRNFINL